MQKTILKPKNWQDFETLCEKLFSEKFEEDFQKNGRNGQGQDGVDIYGIPAGKENYWGIQCKLKTDNGKLTEKEILDEITSAENFEPTLENLIIVSTAPKDVEIERFVRVQNVERKKDGKFGVKLYCWEDTERLLKENYHTYNWHLNNLDVQQRHSVKVCFENGLNELAIEPKMLKKIKKYVHTPFIQNQSKYLSEAHKQALDGLASALKGFDINFPSIRPPMFQTSKVNYAWCDFNLFFQNSGGATLKQWKLRFEIDSKHGVFDDPEEVSIGGIVMPHPKSGKYVWENQVTYEDPDYQPIVQKDSRVIELSIKPAIGIKKIPIQWELLAEDFNASGELLLVVEPEIIIEEEKIEVDSKDNERIEGLPLEYYVV